jgi:hypothetical protein
MADMVSKFEYSAPLHKYAVNATDYLLQYSQYDVLCTGVVVFNRDRKLLLVQRAADEHAFPNMWVSTLGCPLTKVLL